jgi:hypothetical protein
MMSVVAAGCTALCVEHGFSDSKRRGAALKTLPFLFRMHSAITGGGSKVK